jgi:hypothetical protein
MGDSPSPRPTGQPPITIPPSMAARDSILKRAQQVAQIHVSGKEIEEKTISSNWKDFFDEERSVHVPSRRCTFHVYVAGPRKPTGAEGHKTPVILCVHGGGYSGLSFALLAEGLRDECVPDLPCAHLLVTHLSWERYDCLTSHCSELQGTRSLLFPQAP